MRKPNLSPGAIAVLKGIFIILVFCLGLYAGYRVREGEEKCQVITTAGR